MKMTLFLMSILMLFACGEKIDDDDKSNSEQVKPEEPVEPEEPAVLEWSGVEPNAESVRAHLVDPNADEQVAALYYNMKVYAKRGVMIGQQDVLIKRYGESSQNVYADVGDMEKVSGEVPLVNGSDFMFSTAKENDGEEKHKWWADQETLLRKTIYETHKKGMINAISWHLREPYIGEDFYVSGMDKVDPTLKDKAFRSILPGGENHEWYKGKLDKVAEILSETKDDAGNLVPIIFRPFHEFTGSWFWWGIPHYGTPEDYKTVWKMTVEYLRDTKGLHNILYAYSPDRNFITESEYLECYPGDEWVDIVGFDTYENFGQSGENGLNETLDKLTIISDLAKERNKVAALTEFGFSSANQTQYNLYDVYSKYFLKYFTTKEDLEISFSMFWYNGESDYFVPTVEASATAARSFVQFVDSPATLTQEDVTGIYEFHTSE